MIFFILFFLAFPCSACSLLLHVFATFPAFSKIPINTINRPFKIVFNLAAKILKYSSFYPNVWHILNQIPIMFYLSSLIDYFQINTLVLTSVISSHTFLSRFPSTIIFRIFIVIFAIVAISMFLFICTIVLSIDTIFDLSFVLNV